jgi:hypothetical protein
MKRYSIEDELIQSPKYGTYYTKFIKWECERGLISNALLLNKLYLDKVLNVFRIKNFKYTFLLKFSNSRMDLSRIY